MKQKQKTILIIFTLIVLGIIGAFIKVDRVNDNKDLQFSFARDVKDYSKINTKKDEKEEKISEEQFSSVINNSIAQENQESNQKNTNNSQNNSNTVSTSQEFYNAGALDEEKTSFEENINKLKGFELGDNTILKIPRYNNELIVGISTDFAIKEYDKGIKFLDAVGNEIRLILSNEYLNDSFCTDNYSSVDDLNYIDDIEIEGGKQFIKNFYKNGTNEYLQIKNQIFGPEKSFKACYSSNKNKINIGGGLYYYDIVVVGDEKNFIKLIKDIFDIY